VNGFPGPPDERVGTLIGHGTIRYVIIAVAIGLPLFSPTASMVAKLNLVGPTYATAGGQHGLVRAAPT